MYEWAKVIHIVAVISWMAGMLYLPRLFVSHFDAEIGSVQSETFKVMERKVYRFIMSPAMIVAWLAGLYLVHSIGAHMDGWFISKFFLVLIMSAFHGFQGIWLKEFASDQRKRTARFFRVVNEIPAVLMIFIVILVVVKPF